MTEYIPSDATNAYLRMITTGHGQGNTENAAEFSLKIHDIFFNNDLAYLHNFGGAIANQTGVLLRMVIGNMTVLDSVQG